MEELSAKDKTLLKLLERLKETEIDTYNYVVPLFISKRMINLDSIRRDLELAMSIAESLLLLSEGGIYIPKKMNKETISPSFWYTLIISYGRCFASGVIRLEEKDCFPKTSNGEKLKVVHNKLITLRNKFVAHRDESEYEQSVVIYKLPKKLAPNEPYEYRIVSTKAGQATNEEIEEYIELFKHLLAIIADKMDKCKQQMSDRFFDLKPELINALRF